MLRRSTRIQLIIFAVITLVGVSYVSARYVGLTRGLFGPKACTVSAAFPDSGGIFTNAEVTYRGVSVGQVTKLTLIKNGVQVDMRLTNCDHPKVPASASAVVSDRSVIGEQYVNLIPPNGDGPYLTGGEVIPMSRNRIPVSSQTLLTNMDNLVRSVNIGSLQTTVSELGKAFNGNGPALGSLMDATNLLLTAAEQNLPATVSLLETGNKVLSTQLDEAPAFASFNRSLALLSAQFRSSDPDIRALLDHGPAELSVLRSFVVDNRTDLGVTLANLAAVGQLLVQHKDGIDQILALYPGLAAGGQSALHGTYGALGFISNNVNDPPDCGDPSKGLEGYQGTVHRLPTDLRPEAPNTGAHCATGNAKVNVRGSANVPGGDPISTSGGDVAYPRATTANTVVVGDASNGARGMGDQSWLSMLTDALN